MKCPQCMNNQRYMDGMICRSCGYHFALNPKKTPYITDMALKNVIDRVSGNGQYHFTYIQLFAQIYRVIKKKRKLHGYQIGCLIFLLYFLFPGGFVIAVLQISEAPFARGLFVLYAVLGISGLVWFARHPLKVPYSSVSETISTYRKLHPTDRLVEGRAFRKPSSESFDEEIFQYAPDRILIVEHIDIADMLILNRFHLENKTLVVSGHKYPEHAFRACQQFLSQHPDIPVMLIHDASEKGLRMKKRLLSDKFWNLRGKNVRDLGLFPRDADRLRRPMWLPRAASVHRKILCARKTADENISQGYRMPVDIASPRAMMGAVSLAAASGLALLSEELLAEQQRDASSGSFFGGGFG
ncbi:hypothetical protein QUF72_03875 [Desulfobacterales bacterium HSG2]|nr:hypothetical protein [Desulfobacterales bacterium HSG2]